MFDKNQRVPNTKSGVDPNIEMDVTHYAIEEPAHCTQVFQGISVEYSGPDIRVARSLTH